MRDEFLTARSPLEIEPTTFRLARLPAFPRGNAKKSPRSRRGSRLPSRRSATLGSLGQADYGSDIPEAPAGIDDALPRDGIAVPSPIAGSIWAINVAVGARVKAGAVLTW